ncbi:DUF2141 domain-containing protein [Paraglaciecola sp.]|uniref:DUF2141 domain-containing protein n=1 Tax=Paraglaciecola sp. TaxID=1920173 RepID=UPI0030F461F7
MKKTNIIKCLVRFFCLFGYVYNVCGAQLTLELQGRENKSGQLHIAVFFVDGNVTDDTTWDGLVETRKLSHEMGIDTNSMRLFIDDLPQGLTCIRLYLDLNHNQLLERSSLGLPLEPVGFSNNPSLMFGEPKPKDACFLLDDEAHTQKINLQFPKKRERKSKHGVTID